MLVCEYSCLKLGALRETSVIETEKFHTDEWSSLPNDYSTPPLVISIISFVWVKMADSANHELSVTGLTVSWILCTELFGSDAWILGILMSSVWNFLAWISDRGLRRYPTWGSCICRLHVCTLRILVEIFWLRPSIPNITPRYPEKRSILRGQAYFSQDTGGSQQGIRKILGKIITFSLFILLVHHWFSMTVHALVHTSGSLQTDTEMQWYPRSQYQALVDTLSQSPFSTLVLPYFSRSLHFLWRCNLCKRETPAIVGLFYVWTHSSKQPQGSYSVFLLYEMLLYE